MLNVFVPGRHRRVLVKQSCSIDSVPTVKLSHLPLPISEILVSRYRTIAVHRRSAQSNSSFCPIQCSWTQLFLSMHYPFDETTLLDSLVTCQCSTAVQLRHHCRKFSCTQSMSLPLSYLNPGSYCSSDIFFSLQNAHHFINSP